jgi:hypothetical protein
MSGDSDLRAQFDRLRRQDELSASPFASHWAQATRITVPSGRPVLRAAAIAVAVMLVTAAAFLVNRPAPRQTPAAQISQWRSPTAFLLRPRSNQLLTTTPRFGEPIIPSFKEQTNR